MIKTLYVFSLYYMYILEIYMNP